MTPEDLPSFPSAVRRVEAFRNKESRPPLHPLEKRLLWLLGAHLCFLPWALGTMHPWSQVTSLVLGILGLGLALMPRIYDGELIGGDEPPYRWKPWSKLVRWPIFWTGIVLLLYVAIQAANPAWHYVQTPKFWWLTREKNVSWLPSGISAPFAKFNDWRQWIIFASAWLLTCAIWVGLTRRRSLRILLIVLVVNGLALGSLMVAQHLTEGGRIPWPLTALTPARLTASFIYENHAGAYFALVAFAAIALSSWYADHGARSFKKSTPAAALGLAAACLGGAVFFTLSRGAALTLTLSLFVFVAWFLVRKRLKPAAPGANPQVTRIVTGVFILFGLVAFHYLDFSEIYNRFEAMAVERANEPSVSSRLLARSAAADMLRAQGVRGIGAGSFRHFFPEYVVRYPEIYDGGQLFWEHAHDDWLEFPIELGLAGCAIVAAGAAWWVMGLIRRRVMWHPLAMPLLIGCGQTLVHAWIDFPFQCPAVLATWCALIAVAGKGAGD
jgi:hypothetical protein